MNSPTKELETIVKSYLIRDFPNTWNHPRFFNSIGNGNFERHIIDLGWELNVVKDQVMGHDASFHQRRKWREITIRESLYQRILELSERATDDGTKHTRYIACTLVAQLMYRAWFRTRRFPDLLHDDFSNDHILGTIQFKARVMASALFFPKPLVMTARIGFGVLADLASQIAMVNAYSDHFGLLRDKTEHRIKGDFCGQSPGVIFS